MFLQDKRLVQTQDNVKQHVFQIKAFQAHLQHFALQ